MEAIPPVLESGEASSRWKAMRLNVGLLLSIPVLLVVFYFWINMDGPMPVCLMKKLTGLPCPGCGGTRSMMALLRFRFVQALAFNPLAVLAVTGLAAVLGVNILSCLYSGKPRWHLDRISLSKRHWFIVVILLVSNWVYLIFYLK